MEVRCDTFPCDHFNYQLAVCEDDEITWHIDYSVEKGMYRVTRFLNNHYDGEVCFDEVDKDEF